MYMQDPFYVVNYGETVYIVDKEGLKDITLPIAVFDELVVMRYAQLYQAGVLEDLQKQVAENNGHLGSDALRKLLGMETIIDKIVRETKEQAN